MTRLPLPSRMSMKPHWPRLLTIHRQCRYIVSSDCVLTNEGSREPRPSYPRSRIRRRLHSDSSDITTTSSSSEESETEAVYCMCQQVSFGEMIACDNTGNCPYEWYHYGCVGLNAPPKGTWYCPICAPRMNKKS